MSSIKNEIPLQPETYQSPAENIDDRVDLLTRIRQKTAEELKFTFTLPDPRNGVFDTLKNAALKGTGMAGVVAGKWMFNVGEQGHLLRSPGESEQSFHHLREAVEGVGISTALLGAFSIYVANRMRDKK